MKEDANELGNACVKWNKSLGLGFVEKGDGLGMSKGTKFWG